MIELIECCLQLIIYKGKNVKNRHKMEGKGEAERVISGKMCEVLLY